jgi:CheY-like chemotaxis protein
MKKSFSILLVDDSFDDRLFARRALCRNPRFVLVGEVFDGESAIAYLAGEGEYADREKYPFPDVLLLDLKLPRKTGHEVLEWIQSRNFANLQVIVLSGSFLPEDVTRCRELGAHGYFKKEALAEEQLSIISAMEELLDLNVSRPLESPVQR